MINTASYVYVAKSLKSLSMIVIHEMLQYFVG